MVDFLAFKHHMRGLTPWPDIPLPRNGIGGNCENATCRCFLLMVGRKCVDPQSMRGKSGLQECRFCHMLAKTDVAPGGFYGRFLQGSSICGNLRESGCDWHIGGQGGGFPILNRNWRIQGEVGQNARDFLETADIPFSIAAVRQVVKAGSEMVEQYDDVRLAARQVQEIHMGNMAPLAQHARNMLRKHPDLGGEIAQLHEIGPLPHYGGISHGAARPSGIPYDGAKTHLMVGETWKDVRKGRVLAAHCDSVRPDTPLIPTPTTTAVKKLPRRTTSADVRIISGLRQTNLF